MGVRTRKRRLAVPPGVLSHYSRADICVVALDTFEISARPGYYCSRPATMLGVCHLDLELVGAPLMLP